MRCFTCGRESGKEAVFCRQCGARLPLAEKQKPDPEQRPRPKRRRVWILAGIGLLLLGIGVGYAWWRSSPPLEALLPEDVVALASMDAPWWWEASDHLREEPAVREVLERAEREFGLSLKEDVAPWLGQVGVAALQWEDDDPQVLVCAQVRDPVAFARCLARLRSRAERQAGAKWTERSYEGTSLQSIQMPGRYGRTLPVAAAWVRGWIIVGIGEGVAERALDAWSGRAPSLQKNALWPTALSRLPSRPAAWAGIDSGALLEDEYRLSPHWRSLPYLRNITLFALSEEKDGLRMDAVNLPKTEQGRAFWRDMKATPVSAQALERLPDDTAMAVLVNDPSGWWRRIRTALLDSRESSYDRNALERALRDLGPLGSALDRYPGACGAALMWREDQGFGLVALARGEGDETVRRTALDMADWAYRQGEPARQEGDLWTLPGVEKHDPQFAFFPCWSAKGDWLAVSTHPDWLETGTGRLGLQIPSDARQADIIVLGNFKTASPLCGPLFGIGHWSDTVIPAMSLENARWTGWLTLHENGNWQQATFTVRGWRWRQAIGAVIEAMHGECDDC